MADRTCQEIRKVIAQECGARHITNSTKFMNNKDFSYFECVGALYTLQHKFDVKLPESDYDKYKTVGSLTRCIIKQIRNNAKQH